MDDEIVNQGDYAYLQSLYSGKSTSVHNYLHVTTKPVPSEPALNISETKPSGVEMEDELLAFRRTQRHCLGK